MYIKVRVKTGQRKESVERVSPVSFKISVKEKPEKNLANQRVLQIVAECLRVPIKKIKIISGHHSPSKLLSIID